MKNKLFLGLFCMFIVSAGFAAAALPNPGHSAGEIWPGTFNGTSADLWSFPGDLNVAGGINRSNYLWLEKGVNVLLWQGPPMLYGDLVA
ncbi:hypothetical protein KY347_04785, partial [Candidatus Woesearchaeota archaeon]|nr:hypothetical protein [Candidatus Woesearchaeota archaeon]